MVVPEPHIISCFLEDGGEIRIIIPAFVLMDIVAAEHVLEDDTGHVVWRLDTTESTESVLCPFFALVWCGIKGIAVK